MSFLKPFWYFLDRGIAHLKQKVIIVHKAFPSFRIQIETYLNSILIPISKIARLHRILISVLPPFEFRLFQANGNLEKRTQNHRKYHT
jgi:hypothetical protein